MQISVIGVRQGYKDCERAFDQYNFYCHDCG